MEKEIKYAMGYYDAVITHLMTEKEIPNSVESAKGLLTKIADESDMFNDAIFDIGLSFVAERILKGE